MRTMMFKIFRRNKHRHEWVYRPRTLGGWGIVECRTCGATDLY